jgi:hypothetical protein
MRRALGLHGEASLPRPEPVPSTPASHGSPRPPRRFVRDGETPVTIVRRNQSPDIGSGANQLETARQTIRSLTAERERADRLLTEAQKTIRDLQTKLAHERLSKDEAVQRAEYERRASDQALQAAQAQLAAERDARQKVKDALAEALKGRQEAEDRLRDVMALQPTQKAPQRGQVTTQAASETGAEWKTTVQGATGKQRKAARATKMAQPGRPDNGGAEDSEFVEWWIPGWKDKYR